MTQLQFAFQGLVETDNNASLQLRGGNIACTAHTGTATLSDEMKTISAHNVEGAPTFGASPLLANASDAGVEAPVFQTSESKRFDFCWLFYATK